jgi:hypothetical protein
MSLLTILSLPDDQPREKEIVEIRQGNRLQKYLVLNRQQCTHQDGRFGLLVTLCKAGKNNLHGSVNYEAFETPQGELELLGESPDQPGDLQRQHEKDCPLCDRRGTNFSQNCRKCFGSGRVAYTPPKPERKVTLLEF